MATYSSGDLVAIAKARGLTATTRLVTDWISLGLLDRPGRTGLGRGRGTQARWPENQLQLFLTVLRHRRKGAQIPALTNIPVWLWLTSGDDYVPLRQVRRAMKTWGPTASSTSWVKARKLARELVHKLAAPSGRGQRKLIDVVARAALIGRFDAAEVREALQPVIDPKRTGRARGPAEAAVDTESYIRLVQSRYLALNQLDQYSERDFVDARGIYRITRQQYALSQPRFAEDPELGKLYEFPDESEVVNSACSDLLTILGLRSIGEADVKAARRRRTKPAESTT